MRQSRAIAGHQNSFQADLSSDVRQRGEHIGDVGTCIEKKEKRVTLIPTS
jgi:hypothetical protein